MIKQIGISVLAFLALGVSYAYAQDAAVYVDKLGGVWATSPSGVYKYTPELKPISAPYVAFANGVPTYIDVTDPLRVLAFYSTSKTAVLLNSELSPISAAISLQAQTANPQLICRSGKGGFWLLDASVSKLVSLNASFKREGVSIPLSASILPLGAEPLFMQEQKGVVYIGYRGFGIVAFDAFGKLQNVYRVNLQGQFCMYKGGFLFVDSDGIKAYRFSNSQEVSLLGSTTSFPAYSNGSLVEFSAGVMSISQNSSVNFLVGE
ncbi:hypothetical protein DSECCO2_180500 [anaerobic digester metagenome]